MRSTIAGQECKALSKHLLILKKVKSNLQVLIKSAVSIPIRMKSFMLRTHSKVTDANVKQSAIKAKL